jgi:DNA-directed RNA polymerase
MTNYDITTTTDNEDRMFLVQTELEYKMREDGITRAKENIAKQQLKGAESTTDYGHQMMVHGLFKFAEGISEYLGEDDSRGGHSAGTRKLLKGGKPELIAYIFMKSIINSISNKSITLTHAVISAAMDVQDEYMLNGLQRQNKALCKRLIDAGNKREGYKKMLTVTKAMTDEAAKGTIEAWDKWPKKKVLKVGEKLVDILMATVGLVKITTESKGKNNTVKRLVATDETSQWIEQRTNKLGLTTPKYLPLVVPPRDWNYGNLENGCYYTYSCRPVRFVKTSNRNYFEELRNSDIDVVLHAVNAMQKTAWRINTPMVELITELYENEVGWCSSIPAKHAEDAPARLEDYASATIEEKAAYIQEANRVKVSNREARSKRFSFSFILDTANAYAEYPAFWLPYNLDFRGRIYSVSAFNGMGADEMKAVMEFSEGKKLKASGVRYLAIHLANLGDFEKISKKSFDERVQWVVDNEVFIRDCVTNPWDNRGWADADKPLQFIAACMDWVGYLENGEDHVSHTVTCLDGSCSGLQHLSMAMRCSSTAKSVNILPNETPQDVYQTVADKVVKRLVEDSQQPPSHWGEPVLNNMGKRVPNYTELALEWLKFGFTRGYAKRSTMCYSYGSKQYGFREQIIEDVMRPLKRECAKTGMAFPFSYDDGFRASSYIARLLWEAVVDSVKRPAQLMDWLTSTASTVAKTKYTMPDGSDQTLPVRWTTPLGFPVLQSYYNTTKHRVRSHMGGQLIYLTLNEGTDQICSRKSAQGCSPNFVHSLDAAHLQLSVARMTEASDNEASYSMIHDSFGCHAADLSKFSGVIKRSLVEIYDSRDVVHELYKEFLQQLRPEERENLDLPPAKGELDYMDTLLSMYSFA